MLKFSVVYARMMTVLSSFAQMFLEQIKISLKKQGLDDAKMTILQRRDQALF